MKFAHHIFIITSMLWINSTLFCMLSIDVTKDHIKTFHSIYQVNHPYFWDAAHELKILSIKDPAWKMILNDRDKTFELFSFIKSEERLITAAFLGTFGAIALAREYIKNDLEAQTNLIDLLTRLAGVESKKMKCKNQDLDVATTILDIMEIEKFQDKFSCASALRTAVVEGKIEFVKLLLDRGIYIESTNDYWKRTPIMWASYHGYNDMLDFLIKRKANINARTNCRETALLLAVQRAQVVTVKKLIECGADIHIKDMFGESALTVAQRHRSYGYSHKEKYGEIAQILLDAGAKQKSLL